MRPFAAAFLLFALAACSSSPQNPTAEVSDAAPGPQAPASSCEPKPPDPTRFPLDPVELRRGREIPGSDERVERSGMYSYAFASAENQAAFRADPGRYEVQLGGACARMGPLSGDGNVTLFALHEDKLYLFASKACRAAFVKAPEKYLEVDDPAPSPELATPEARRRGAELLDKALAWMGGAQAVDSVRTLSEFREREETSGDRTYRVKNELQLDFEHGWARENECWDASCFGNVIGRNGAFSTGKESTPLVAVQRAAFERAIGHGLLAALRRRNEPGAIVHAGWGESPVASCARGGSGSQRTRAQVAIWSRGTETRLHVGVDDGSIDMLEFRGRDATLLMAEIQVVLDDWRPCGPLRLPFRRTVRGESDAAPEIVLSAVQVDLPLDPVLFDG